MLNYLSWPWTHIVVYTHTHAHILAGLGILCVGRWGCSWIDKYPPASVFLMRPLKDCTTTARLHCKFLNLNLLSSRDFGHNTRPSLEDYVCKIFQTENWVCGSHLNYHYWCVSFSSLSFEQIPGKSNSREEGLFWLSSEQCSAVPPSQAGMHGGRRGWVHNFRTPKIVTGLISLYSLYKVLA